MTPAPSALPARPGRLGRPFWLTMAAVLAMKLLFLVTYPLNVSGDGATYASMMRSRTSALAHAGGYPFLLGLPVAVPRALLKAVRDPGGTLASFSGQRRLPPETPPEPDGTRARKSMRLPPRYTSVMNHLVDAVAIAALFLLLRAVFGTGAAVVGTLGYGLNPWNVQWATLSRPEPMQSALVVIALALCYRAWRSDVGVKRRRYVAGFAVFALAVLVKPNAALLGSVPLALLALDPSPWRERLRCAVSGGLAAVAVVGIFVLAYHRPSTGTVRLDQLSGHNLFERLRRNPEPLYDPDHGPASKTLAILTRVLPPEPASCCGATLFSHVDWVPAAERAPYRERWLPLLETQDREALERAWAEVRDRPAGKVTSLHYYLGLPEANGLLRAVFFETVRARPGAYLAGTWTLFQETFFEPLTVLVPVPSDFPGADPRIAVLDRLELTPRGGGFARVAGAAHESRMLGYAKGSTLWRPGAYAMPAWFRVTRIETWILWILAVAGAVLALVDPSAAADADARAARWGPALLVAALVVFFALWALVFDVRNKDMRLVQPLLDALAAVGAWKLARLVTTRARSAARPASS